MFILHFPRQAMRRKTTIQTTDPKIRIELIHYFNHVPPNVIIRTIFRNRSIFLNRIVHIISSVFDKIFMKYRVDMVRQNLINTSAKNYVSRETKTYGILRFWNNIHGLGSNGIKNKKKRLFTKKFMICKSGNQSIYKHVYEKTMVVYLQNFIFRKNM